MSASSQGLDTVIGPGSTTSPEEALQKAAQLEQEGDRIGAIEALRGASAGSDERVLFRLAWLLDLCGEEDEAVHFYQHCVDASDRPLVNALINLAVILEDRGEFASAEKYLEMVVNTNPNNCRARLFLRDVRASKDMYYDEAEARDLAKQNALMDTPVTDFELSVRARNCLKKMEIRTLGDLLKVSESELLSYKNFGETSLVEIKAMLTSRGLRLGQNLETQYHRVRAEVYDDLRELASDEVLNRPISSLEFSVRARKALQILGVQTVGDLATRTEAELMGIKNFGTTSLVEIRERLATVGLDLRTLD
ncbi:MAG: DNA-directed RNA polymerase subunit alpha C-terminal domain-containing protein [Phycisphaerales bacterium]|jgi:DNA-directed RNA polymerase subunit alpha|nr:DNA-directed RNA polymerase subunit alpha C-terminal domain-containing protein [Phycisphaerales bacterium]